MTSKKGGKQKQNRRATEGLLLRAARRYARLKLLGVFTENGHIVHAAPGDNLDMLEYYKRQLLREAELLVTIMSFDDSGGDSLED